MTIQTFMKRAGVMGAAALLSLHAAAAQERVQPLDGGTAAPVAAKSDASPAGAKADTAKASATEKSGKDDVKRTRNGKERKETKAAQTGSPSIAASSTGEATKAMAAAATVEAAAPKQDATPTTGAVLPTAPGAGSVQSAPPATSTPAAATAAAPSATASTPAQPASPNVDLRRTRAASVLPTPPGDPRINFGVGRHGPHGEAIAPPNQTPLWNVAFDFGAERSDEKYIADTAIVLRFRAEASRVLAQNFLLLASFDFRSYKQPYAINTTASSGGASAPTIIGEERYEAAAGAGYDLGPHLLADGRLALLPTLQLRYLRLQNDAFPTNLFGLEAGARASFELSSAVSAHLRVGYTFNFAQSTTQSGVGAPRALTLWSAGIALPLAGGYALSIDYTGNALTLANVIRLAEGVTLGFSYSF